ncbi:MAG: cupin domain-containing protein, partial [Cytophagaceae bacterium]
MRILFEKIPTTSHNNCFTVRDFRCTQFDMPLHIHPEYELTYIIEGQGKRVVGDSIADYSAGDLVLVGANLPHCWYSDIRPHALESLSRTRSPYFHNLMASSPTWFRTLTGDPLVKLKPLTPLMFQTARRRSVNSTSWKQATTKMRTTPRSLS